MKKLLTIAAISFFAILLGFKTVYISDVLKIWGIQKLLTFELPLPDSSVHGKFPSEKYYFAFPERAIYKTHPFM